LKQSYGYERTIYIGPRAQAVLKHWLRTDLQAYLFSPIDAEAARNAEKRRNRKTPMTPSQRKRKPKRNRKRPPRQRYDVASYRRAIQCGCDLAKVPKWHPHQLRHNAATWLRKEFGLDVARVVLGHRSPAITELP
jgi:integrase